MEEKTLETQRLLLRPITIDDAEVLFGICKNEHIGFNAGWKPHDNIEETIDVLKAFYIDKPNAYGIQLKETGELIGSLGIVTDPKRQNDKSLMLGYNIAEEHWGKGYATEASCQVIEATWQKTDIQIISAYCYPFNERSKRVLEKCGFTYEGRLQLAEKRYDGTVADHECYSIIRRD